MNGYLQKNSKIQVGIIGGNFGTLVHLPAFRLDPRTHVSAISASTAQRSKELAEQFGISKHYDHWQAMLDDPSIDAISIAVPPPLQAEIILQAFEQGKAIFAEKPLTSHLNEALQLQRAAIEKNLPNMINFHLPMLSPWQQAKHILDSQGIGKIRHIIVQWCSESKTNVLKQDHWKVMKGPGQGALFDFLCTVLFCIEWFVEPIQSLHATLFSTMPSHSGPKDTFDVVTAKLVSGIPVSITLSTAAFLGNGHRIEFSGEEGCLLLENTQRDVSGFKLYLGTRTKPALSNIYPEEESQTAQAKDPSDGRILSTAKLIHRFLNWIETGEPQSPNFKDGLRIQTLLEAAWKSDLSGQWITL